MAIVISAPPTIDTSALAARMATGGKTPLRDPTFEMCRAYGFQTLYDMPATMQLQARRKLIQDHAQAVAGDPALVCEFSVFGWLADWMRWFWHSTPTELWDEVVADAKRASDGYREIHHVADGTHRSYDGFHWLDARNARQIDGLMRHLYREFGVADRVRYHPAKPA